MKSLVVPFLLVLVLATSALAQGGPPAARVVTDTVRQQDLVQRRLVIGQLRASRRSLLATEVEGRLVELPFREGHAVGRGDVVARTDASLFEREVERAAAQVASGDARVVELEAGVEKAERDLPRLERLLAESAAVSQTAVDDAVTAVAETHARLASARASLAAAQATEATARERLADTRVRAPFAGHVVERRAEVGEWLRAGDPVLELVEVAPIEAWLAIPEEDLVALREPGATVEVRVPAIGLVTVLPVDAIVPDVDPVAHTFALIVRLSNADGALRPGLRVIGRVPTSQRAATLTVHPDAILRDDSGERIFVVADGAARALRVETLFLAGDRVAVRADGLSAGDLAIIEGNERLFPGQPVAATGG